MHLLQRAEVLLVGRLGLRPGDFRLFEVRRVFAPAAVDHAVLSGFGRHEKLVGEAAADAPRVRLHGPEFEAAARENPAVGVEHLPVADIRSLAVRVEAVGVLHAEFAAAHDAEARPDLVAEFRLDLIEVERELSVGLDLVADQVGDDLFVGGAEAALPVMAVPEPQQLLSVMGPASRFLPEFRRLHGGEKDLLGAGAVHFLADDLFELPDHPVAQREVGIHPAGELPDHAGPQHELVADHLRVGRDLPHRRQKHL